MLIRTGERGDMMADGLKQEAREKITAEFYALKQKQFHLPAALRPTPEKPLYQQLYDYLRAAILSGQLEGGAALPSTRALADELNISRNTVLNTYEQLLAEGYLESVRGKGTFVARVLPEQSLASAAPRVALPQMPGQRVHRLSDSAAAMLQTPGMPAFNGRAPQAFQSGMAALDAFPYDLWSKLLARHAQALHPGAMIYQDAAGYRPLREAIANHVILTRQVRCTADQVIIVTGSQGALYLAARVLLNAGDAAWIEDLAYLGARSVLTAAGARVIPVPVDEQGLNVSTGLQRAPDARLAYLTPSHQFPLGVTLSLSRRLELLDWAARTGAYLLEDDYDSEYRFNGRPLASLQGLDHHESVIYIGTFSKVMFPALRLGYVIVPPALVEAFVTMRRAIEYHPPVLEQAALADFIAEGHFMRHIRRMRVLYAHRRTVLMDALRATPLEVSAPETGMHLIGWLPEGVDAHAVMRRAAAHQVRVLPVSTFALEAQQREGLLLGYAAVNDDALRAGVVRLSAALAEAQDEAC